MEMMVFLFPIIFTCSSILVSIDGQQNYNNSSIVDDVTVPTVETISIVSNNLTATTSNSGTTTTTTAQQSSINNTITTTTAASNSGEINTTDQTVTPENEKISSTILFIDDGDISNTTESSTITSASTPRGFTVTSRPSTEPVPEPSAPVALNFHSANVTYSSFNVTWRRPHKHYGTSDVKDYILHYYLTKDTNDDTLHHRVLLGANETWYVISEVRSGTSYSAHLITRFAANSRNPSLTSITRNIDVLTKGFGPDHPCPCDAHGAVNKSLCDQVTSHCMCRSAYEGAHCERCVTGFYRFRNKPCQPCPCDRNKSTGNCTVLNVGKSRQIVECHCLGKRIGQFCQYCDNGFYTNKTSHQCFKCGCNGNEKLNSNKLCNSVTGRCYNCKFNTTGFHCGRCLPGFEGDPIIAKNCSLIDYPHRVRHPTLAENKNVVMGVTATFGSILLIIIFIIGCKKYHTWRRWQPQPFWTVELKDDHETVSFSSMVEQDYQNVDAALLIDDVNYYDRGLSGQLRVGSPEPVSYNSINA
ncbi:uncharacterized protein LOC141908396 [Tubulanus polymorphus]|uniref:uncharacterized protein LOC141908396 n=1 Tax=Tubulanus polymorphus TaxID=672921 RepID=UPI003DA4FC56